MLFFILTLIASILSIGVPLLLLGIMAKRWKLPRQIFWRAGLFGLLISLIVLGITLNIDSSFPQFTQLSLWTQVIILAFVHGLFLELGKFLVLDRFMPYVRTRESALLFGLGWAGLGIFVTGCFWFIGMFGMNTLLNTNDIPSAFPEADTTQIQLLQEGQQQLRVLVSQTPFKALTPLLENFSLLLLDIAMTLIVVFGLSKDRASNVWFAVAIRTALVSLLISANQLKNIPVEIIYGLWTLLAVAIILLYQKKLPSMSFVQKNPTDKDMP